MKSLKLFITECLINEGGASGHMKHVFDYDDLTLNDLRDLIQDLFSGRIVKITEKIDGMNIQVTLNRDGEVMFIRNKGDLNNPRGGMSIEDMKNKWKDKPLVQKVFVESGRILSNVLPQLGIEFFNPDESTRLYLNCECMTEGTTNILPYISSRVNVHDIWVYEYIDGTWTHTSTTRENIDRIGELTSTDSGIQLTPQVIIDTANKSLDLMTQYTDELFNLFKKQGLKGKDTILDYKKSKWSDEVNKLGVPDDYPLFDRYILDNKTGESSLRSLKQNYGEYLPILDRNIKNIRYNVTLDLNLLFIRLGNDVLSLCKGLTNELGKDKVIDSLTRELNKTIKDIEDDPETSDEARDKLFKYLEVFTRADKKVNSAEGIVFTYNGRLMKLTGTFGVINQILGGLKYNHK